MKQKLNRIILMPLKQHILTKFPQRNKTHFDKSTRKNQNPTKPRIPIFHSLRGKKDQHPEINYKKNREKLTFFSQFSSSGQWFWLSMSTHNSNPFIACKNSHRTHFICNDHKSTKKVPNHFPVLIINQERKRRADIQAELVNQKCYQIKRQNRRKNFLLWARNLVGEAILGNGYGCIFG